jgi:ABC-type branched-subunit amino acid transport system substrate-binding protein
MIRSSFTWRGLATIAAATLVLTACGGGEETDTGAAPAETAVAKGDGVLTLGTLLPQTGSLAFLGPPEFAGVELAVRDINKAGGVLGKNVTKYDSDSGDTSTDIASQSVDRLLSQKVDAIIGAASSSVSLSVIDKVTGAGVVHFSPANTSDQFTTYNDKGLYWRTAPPDVLQGRVLGDLVVADGNTTVGILALQDAYGTGLANNSGKAIADGGGELTPAKPIIYDPKAAEYSAEVAQIKAANPDAIVLIGFDESKKLFPELIKQGLPPTTKKWYLVDGNCSNYGKELPANTLVTAKCTYPGPEVKSDFVAKLRSVDPKVKDTTYGPESYDAAIVTALAAEAAKNDSGQAIASALEQVTKGGEKCTSFEQCKKLLGEGKDIDYDGVSGPIEFNDKGDPTQATIGIFQYDATNTIKPVEYKLGKL